MSERIPLKPTEDDFDWWISRFVPDNILWWWDDSSIPDEDRTMRVLNRAGYRNDPVISKIEYVNAFHTWAMPENVERIIIDDGRWVDALSDDERQRASELQVRFKRGLCIPQQRFGEDLPVPEHVMFDGRVVLDQRMWASLPIEARRSVIESELADWDRDATYAVPEESPSHIAAIANAFVRNEGVNCFAVTAFALTADQDDLHRWMFPDAFKAIVENAGFKTTDEPTPLADDIVVFLNDERDVVHAAYVIQPDRILNKSGQSSFNPAAIVDFAELLGDWTEYTHAIFRR